MIGSRQRRREAFLRLVAVFISLVAAAIMVFFVLRLVNKRMASDRKARVAVETERQHFEENVSTFRVQRDDLSGGPRTAPREIVPNADVLDMSANSPPPRAVSSRPAAGSETPSAAPAGPKVIENLDQKQAAIGEVLRQFFEARTVTQLLPVVRDSRRVLPLIEEFYKRGPVKGRTWKAVGWTIPVDEPGYRFAYVQATFEDAPPVNVVVEETESGFLVDWESAFQYSEMSWREFMSAKPGRPTLFRVVVTKAEAGGAGGAALSIKHPFEEGLVIGRFDPADPRFRSLVEQLDLCKWKDVPVILRLNYPGLGTEPNEVQIAGVEGKGWLILGAQNRGS